MWVSRFIQSIKCVSFWLLNSFLIVIAIIFDIKIDKNHDIWIGSKILTVKNELNNNNFKL